MSTYQVSWASLNEFREFNRNLPAIKQDIDKKHFPDKKAKAVAEAKGVAAQGIANGILAEFCKQLLEHAEKADMTAKDLKALEDMTTLIKKSIAKIKESPAGSALPDTPNKPPVLHSQSPRSQSELPNPTPVSTVSEFKIEEQGKGNHLTRPVPDEAQEDQEDQGDYQPIGFQSNNSFNFNNLFRFFSRLNPPFLPFPNTESIIVSAEQNWKEVATPAIILKIIQDKNYWKSKTKLMPKGIQAMQKELRAQSSSNENTKFQAMKPIAAARQWSYWFSYLTSRSNETQYLYDVLCSKNQNFYQDKNFQKLYTDWFNYNHPQNTLQKKNR